MMRLGSVILDSSKARVRMPSGVRSKRTRLRLFSLPAHDEVAQTELPTASVPAVCRGRGRAAPSGIQKISVTAIRSFQALRLRAALLWAAAATRPLP